MKSFNGKIAVISGGGTGMGRELARQLSAAGCHVAICDVSEENMAQTRALCEAAAPTGTRITTHLANVSDESQVLRFRDQVIEEQQTDCVHLVFNNAGIGGEGSILDDADRDAWDRIYSVCWNGVYFGTRAFLPLLVAADEGHLVNTSSVNGLWAAYGPNELLSAYCTAKFAVRGFSESLIEDFRLNCPHVKVSVVIPGYIGTSISINSRQMLGTDPKQMSDEEVLDARDRLTASGLDIAAGATAEDIRQAVVMRNESYRNDAPVTAAEAASIIIDGVRQEKWRILVGDDAHAIDRLVREDPENVYSVEFMERVAAMY